MNIKSEASTTDTSNSKTRSVSTYKLNSNYSKIKFGKFKNLNDYDKLNKEERINPCLYPPEIPINQYDKGLLNLVEKG